MFWHWIFLKGKESASEDLTEPRSICGGAFWCTSMFLQNLRKMSLEWFGVNTSHKRDFNVVASILKGNLCWKIGSIGWNCDQKNLWNLASFSQTSVWQAQSILYKFSWWQIGIGISDKHIYIYQTYIPHTHTHIRFLSCFWTRGHGYQREPKSLFNKQKPLTINIH